MAEKRFIISDASKQVDVEAHVLRYWEEELGLEIPRNEMGHRYYTEDNIKILKNIKLLKDQGFQLKAIKMVLPELLTSNEANLEYMLGLKEELNSRVLEEERNGTQPNIMDTYTSNKNNQNEQTLFSEMLEEDQVMIHATQTNQTVSQASSSSQERTQMSADKMQQFQLIISNIITQALIDNNPLLGQDISDRVSDNVLKEMDYLMRLRDEKEEERFRRLDETIRSYQKSRSESAATQREQKRAQRKRRGLFGRNKTIPS